MNGVCQLSLGSVKILWEKRNVLIPDSQRETDDAACMRGDGKGLCYITWLVFQGFSWGLWVELPEYSRLYVQGLKNKAFYELSKSGAACL